MDSPRPGTPRSYGESSHDMDGVYRSVFQQPVLSIPPTAPSYSWIEFLLIPEALEQHLVTLRKEKQQNEHSEISAIELIREFLDQAQLVSDEGNSGNQRFISLLATAAKVVVEMNISLPEIENLFPIHYQRFLMDGLAAMKTNELMFNRWIIRAITKQHLASPFCAESKIAAEEFAAGAQVALGDFFADQRAIAQNLKSLLSDVKTLEANPAWMDLGVYYFNIEQYAIAFECFGSADPKSDDFAPLEKERLEGYLLACKSVLSKQEQSSKQWIKQAWKAQRWDEIIQKLNKEILTADTEDGEIGICVDDRTLLEEAAFRQARRCAEMSTSSTAERRISRMFYSELVVSNTGFRLWTATTSELVFVQDELHHRFINLLYSEMQSEAMDALDESPNSSIEESVTFASLATKIVDLFCFLLEKSKGTEQQKVADDKVDRLCRTFENLLVSFPALHSLPGTRRFLSQCPSLHLNWSDQDHTIAQLFSQELRLQKIDRKQQIADSVTKYSLGTKQAKMEFYSTLLQRVSNAKEDDTLELLTAIACCMVDNRWNILYEWEGRMRDSTDETTTIVRMKLQLAVCFGDIAKLLASDSHLLEKSSRSFKSTEQALDLTKSQTLFSALVSAQKSLNVDSTKPFSFSWDDILDEIPQSLLQQVVDIAAGLYSHCLVQYKSRNMFDLTPFGDLALVAFANATTDQETPKGFRQDIAKLLQSGVSKLVQRCPNNSQWHVARASLLLNPITPHLESDPRAALSEYILAASLATNHFSESRAVTDVIDQVHLVKLSQCLVQLDNVVAAAVVYQYFAPEEVKYGLQLVSQASDTCDQGYFQYFWELSFLEVLMQVFANPARYNQSAIKLLTNLVQTPELNACNSETVLETLKHRMLRCYFRHLCRRYLSISFIIDFSDMMHRNPILGGTTYDPRLKSHSKPQRFKIIQPTMRIDSKALIVPSISSEKRYFETSAAEIGKLDRNSLLESKFAPQNVDKVLRFYAFFLETVDESNLEELRLRKSVVLVYVSDNTFEIQEPRMLNSGIPQGAFLKRCQLPKVSGFYVASDLSLRMELAVFGRIFKICDCDAFTREYFARMGWNIGCSIIIPEDKYTVTRKEITKMCGGDVDHFYGKKRYPLKTFMEASLGNSVRSHLQSEKKRKFLANACKILCFHCEHDAQEQLYGALKRYKLCFFLEDDTMEIKEVLSPNSGRLPFPLLLKRTRQLKAWTEFLSDEQDRGVEEPKPREAYFNEEDLYVGAVLNVFGRELKLVDTDAFTRDYYRVVWGMELAEPMSTAPEEIASPTRKPLAEKSTLDPAQAPKKDLLKLVEFDRKVLRFVAKLISNRKEQAQRRVVIAYYLADDTIAIFEPEQRNSGISPGKFLERGQYKSPQGKPYVFSQLAIGEELTFNAHRFELLDADEYTKKFLAA